MRQNPLELSGHRGHRLWLEEARVVLDVAFDSAGALPQRERELEPRRRRVDLEGIELEAVHRPLRRGRVLQHEHHLDQAMARSLRLCASLRHAVEGEILVRLGVQERRAHAIEELDERWPFRQVDTDREDVGEEADHRVQTRPVAIGHGGPQHDVRATRLPVHEQEEGRQRRHVQRAAPVGRHLVDGACELRRNREAMPRAVERQRARPRAVHGQIERRGGARQVVAPEGQALRDHAGRERPRLRRAVVRILRRQRFELRFAAAAVAGVVSAELRHENAA